MANERETPELLKWLSKAFIALNWFSVGVRAGTIVVEHTNECKCIKQTYYKTPEHNLKT